MQTSNHSSHRIFALVAFLASSSVAFSQNATNGDVATDDGVIETITVTGSRIKTSNASATIPTQVLDVGEIHAAGSTDLGEIIEQLPGVFLGISPTNSRLSTQNAGLSTVDLRSLSTNRTLTLINGRRVVSNSGSAQRVDTGTIPSGFIQTVEITTGGASAIYGSDAIAGVANIILKDEFEGLELETRYEESFEGGAERPSFDATWGMNFAGGRGNVMVGGMYEDRKPVFARDRDFAAGQSFEFDLATGERTPNLSSFLPGGRFEGDAWNIGGVWQNDVAGTYGVNGAFCIDDGRLPACDDYQEAFDGYDFTPFTQIEPERERWGTLAKVKYDLTDTMTGWFQFQFANIETKAQRAAGNAQDASTYGPFDNEVRIGDLPDTHPFIHPAVEGTLSGTVDWRRRFVEVGQRFRASKRETSRFGLGLEGQINDSWYWDVYVGYGNHLQRQIRENELNLLKIDLALDVVADPVTGALQCADAAARADGCVPLNVFGEGSVSPEAADYIRATDRLRQELDQTVASISFGGDLFELPAGVVKTAFGLDYRKEEQQTSGDPDTNAGLTTTGFIPDVVGEFDVKEAFVEFSVPLVADKPGIQSLDLTTAYRFADYNSVGNVSSWNLGLSWAPSDDIRFRGQVSQSQRAPDITELFSSQRSDFDDLRDPCLGVTLVSAGVVDDNCRSIPSVVQAINDEIADALAADPNVDPNTIGFDQDGNSIFGPNVGNPNLFEETGETITYGFVLTPRFIPGFSLIADYYKIEVDDAVASVDSQLAADLCYEDPTFSNRFCDSISRDADGQVDRIINQSENLNLLISEGIDVTLEYDFDIGSIPGDFQTQILYTHVKRNEEQFTGPDGLVIDDFAGEIGLPTDEYRFTARYEPTDAWSFRYRMKYTGTGFDDNNADPDDLLASIKFEPVLVHDVYASYEFGDEHDYRIFLGVENIEDQHGPFLPDDFLNGEDHNVGDSYDSVGRRFYVGIDFTW